MTTVAIHQPQYLPYLGFFHKLARCNTLIVLDDVQFQKNGLQNRNKIKGAGGWQWLTVPVLHRFGQVINEVAVNSTVVWGHKHWQALVSSYSPAPFFSTYAPELKSLLLDQTYTQLCQLDLIMTRWAMGALNLDCPIVLSSELNVGGAKTERLINLSRAVGATCYLSGPGGKRYMDVEAFHRAGIRIEFQTFESPTYDQVFPKQGFCPDLSVVDALFCCGTGAQAFIA